MLVLLLACAPPTTEISSISAVDDKPAFQVEFSSSEALTSAWVDVGEEGHFHRRTPASSSDGGYTWSALVLGVPASTTGELSAGGELDGLLATPAVESVDAPAAPAQGLELVGLSGYDNPLPGYVVCATAKPNPGGAVIYDRNTRPLWWSGLDPTSVVNEARVTPDGRGLEWLEGQGPDLLHTDFFDGTSSTLTIKDAHHSFYQLPDGGRAVIVADVRDYEGTSVQGDAVVEYEADGTLRRTVWSSWDSMTPDLDNLWMGEGWTGAQTWVHMNSLDFDPDTGDYLVSLYALDEVLRIDGQTGEVEWTVGGADATLPLVSGDAFSLQHSPRFTDDGFLIFDNGPIDRMSSVVNRYSLDLDAGTSAEAWSFSPDRPMYTTVLGNADPTPDGGLLVAFGTAGAIIRLDADLQPMAARVGYLGTTTGFCHEVDSLLGDAPIPED